MKVLITADPIEALLLEMDASIAMAVAMLDANIEVDWCVLADQDLKNPDYLNALKARKILRFERRENTDHPVFADYKTVNASDYDVVIHRKDPPVDEFFIEHHKKFLSLSDKVLQINHPKVTLKYAEHELPQLFPEYSIPTQTLKSFDDAFAFAKSNSFKVVLKPHNTSSGNGISFVFSESEMLQSKNALESGYPLVGQPFIPNIEKVGDLRVLYFNGVHLGQILRFPAKGSLLANIHQGGSVTKAELTPQQSKASDQVAKTLLPMGAVLIGIDFLGDKVSEVNITSPMGFRQLNTLYGVESHKDFVNLLIKKVKG